MDERRTIARTIKTKGLHYICYLLCYLYLNNSNKIYQNYFYDIILVILLESITIYIHTLIISVLKQSHTRLLNTLYWNVLLHYSKPQTYSFSAHFTYSFNTVSGVPTGDSRYGVGEGAKTPDTTTDHPAESSNGMCVRPSGQETSPDTAAATTAHQPPPVKRVASPTAPANSVATIMDVVSPIFHFVICVQCSRREF